MLYVKVLNSEDGGVLLTKRTDDSKVSEVVLSTHAWNMLCRYQQDASLALEKNTLAQWTLEKISDQASLMLTVAPYNNMHLASIRIYAQGQATRQGVSVGSTGFAYLRGFLNTNSEFQLGRSEYKRLVMEQVYEGHAKNCEGCVTDRGSQRSHMSETPIQRQRADKGDRRRPFQLSSSPCYEVCQSKDLLKSPPSSLQASTL